MWCIYVGLVPEYELSDVPMTSITPHHPLFRMLWYRVPNTVWALQYIL